MTMTTYECNLHLVTDFIRQIRFLANDYKTDLLEIIEKFKTFPNKEKLNVNHKVWEMNVADILFLFDLIKTDRVDNYILFKYDLISMCSSDIDYDDLWHIYDGLLVQMRGVIVDECDGNIISAPYYKFRNLNECEEYSEKNVMKAIQKNGMKFEVTEKLDGSLIAASYDALNYRFVISTTGTIEGSEKASKGVQIACANKYITESMLEMFETYANETFLFELIDPEDDHVINYKETGLFLHGIRSKVSGELESSDAIEAIARIYDCKTTKRYNSKILSDYINKANNDTDAKQEGYVINIDGWLIKLKFKEYLKLHNLKNIVQGNCDFRSIEEMVFDGSIDDIISKIEIEGLKNKIKAVVDKILFYQKSMAKTTQSFYDQIPDWVRVNKKEYAECVNKMPRLYRQYLFQMNNEGIKANEINYCKKNHSYLRKSEFEKRYKEMMK